MPGTRTPSTSTAGALAPLRTPLVIPDPVPISRWPFTVLTCLLALAGAALVADRVMLVRDTAPAPRWSAETRAVSLSMAGQTLKVPANYIADAAQRDGGARNRLDLAARLPSLEGFDATHAPLFRDETSLVRVWLEEAPSPVAQTLQTGAMQTGTMQTGTAQTMTSRERLSDDAEFRAGVYPVAGGLFARAFTASSAYASEEIVYDATGLRENRTTPYAARCQKWNVSKATCLRRVPLAPGLTMTYRFPRENLGQWDRLDRSVTQLVQSFIKAPGSASH